MASIFILPRYYLSLGFNESGFLEGIDLFFPAPNTKICRRDFFNA